MLTKWQVGLAATVVFIVGSLSLHRSTRHPAKSQVEAAVSSRRFSNKHPGREIMRMNRTEQLNSILSSTDPLQRPIEFGTAFADWLEADLDGALRFLRSMPRGNEFTEGLTMGIEHIGAGNPQGALALANELARFPQEMHVYNLLFANVTTADPSNALTMVNQAPVGLARENAIRSLGSTWAKTDVQSALSWAGSLAEPSERDAALESVLLAQADHEPAQALKTGLETLSGDALAKVVEAAFSEMVKQHSQGSPGEIDDQSQDSVWPLLDKIPPESISMATAGQIGNFIAEKDPEDALNWADKLTNPEAQRIARAAALNAWAGTDPEAAGAYILTLPSGAEQIAAATQFVRGLGTTDQQAAFSWAQAIKNPELRSTVLVQLTSTIAEQSPQEAIAWVNSWPAETPERSEALAAARSYLALPEPDLDLRSPSSSSAK